LRSASEIYLSSLESAAEISRELVWSTERADLLAKHDFKTSAWIEEAMDLRSELASLPWVFW